MSSGGPVQICSRAATLVGGKPFASFNQGSTEADLASLHYADVRDAVMSAYEWTFATARFGPMTPVADAPIFEFTHAYNLPSGHLKVVFLTTKDHRNGRLQVEEYAVEGQQVLTNYGSGLYLKYIQRVEDATLFEPLFREALVARLAAEFAQPLSASGALADRMFQLYEAKVSEASAVDNQQGRNVQTYTTRHTSARWSDGVYPGWPGYQG